MVLILYIDKSRNILLILIIMRGSGVENRGPNIQRRSMDYRPNIGHFNVNQNPNAFGQSLPLFQSGPIGNPQPPQQPAQLTQPPTYRPFATSQVGLINSSNNLHQTPYFPDHGSSQPPAERQHNKTFPNTQKPPAPILTPSKPITQGTNANLKTSLAKFQQKPLTPTTVGSFNDTNQNGSNIPSEANTQKNETSSQRIESKFSFKYSFKSQKGYNPTFNKPNQDACIVLVNANKRQWEHFFAVCDGHGQNGHIISSLLRSIFLETISKNLQFYQKPKENLYYAFRGSMQRVMREKIDLSNSGSTMVSCYIVNNKLYCANVGDSRAIMGMKDSTTRKWSVRALSNDHKPNIPAEAERIHKCNGRIGYLMDKKGNPIGPPRIWFKDRQTPGLAMSRSIGDLIGAQIGVTWQPEIIEYSINPSDRILLIASDGIWEFLSNQEVINKMAIFYEKDELSKASSFLVEYATASWNKNTTIVDDISFILIFLVHS